MKLEMDMLINQSKKRFIKNQRVIFSILLILTILAAGSLPANAYTIGSYWLCKDVDESSLPHKPIDPTAVFYDTDERVCFLFILENVPTSHDLIMKYYHEDKLFDTDYNKIPDPSSEGYEYWAHFSYNHYLPVKGDDAADLPGQWRIEVYIDGKKEFMESFEIRSTTTATTTPDTTTTPTTTSSPPPAPPPRRIEPQEEALITSNLTSTTHQEEEKTEPSNFLSNPMYLIMIFSTIIIVTIFIFLAKRKKPIISNHMEVSNTRCMHCGEPLEPEDPFCGSCGKKIE